MTAFFEMLNWIFEISQLLPLFPRGWRLDVPSHPLKYDLAVRIELLLKYHLRVISKTQVKGLILAQNERWRRG